MVRISFLLLALSIAAAGQPARSIERAPDVEVKAFRTDRMDDAAVERFVRGALALGLPDEQIDNVYLLLRDRPKVGVPLVETELRRVRKLASPPPRLRERLADLLAYSASEAGIEALSEVAADDHDTFAPFVTRSFNYAWGWTNPYRLAFIATGSTTQRLDAAIAEWTETSLATPERRRLFHDTVVVRLGPNAWEHAHENGMLSRFSRQTLLYVQQAAEPPSQH